ncbi:MAG: hypothetical protein M3N54_13825 [Acidobacteriota bacterium]|nr:hypothetical protein [Acidobacteriota bacterium]
MAFGAFADPIQPGTRIEVRSNETIDVRGVDNGRIYTGSVANDVVDADGRVKIPRGAQAELIVRRVGPNDLSIDLEAVIVDGRHYSVDSRPTERTREAGQGNNGNVGENRRTGEYVGGGALFGSIIGAVAGGGKGAAIGALAGAGAGAGAQVMTRGAAVHIPAESMLSFRLDRALDIYEDRGTDRDGHHYHSYSQYDYQNDHPQQR